MKNNGRCCEARGLIEIYDVTEGVRTAYRQPQQKSALEGGKEGTYLLVVKSNDFTTTPMSISTPGKFKKVQLQARHSEL